MEYAEMTCIEKVRHRLAIYRELEKKNYWIRANQTTFVIEFGTIDKYSQYKELVGYIDKNTGCVIHLNKNTQGVY